LRTLFRAEKIIGCRKHYPPLFTYWLSYQLLMLDYGYYFPLRIRLLNDFQREFMTTLFDAHYFPSSYWCEDDFQYMDIANFNPLCSVKFSYLKFPPSSPAYKSYHWVAPLPTLAIR
jgi:hypothetical protein